MDSTLDLNILPSFAMGHAGSQRDFLNGQALAGIKVATSHPFDEADPQSYQNEIGSLHALLGSDGQVVAIIRITESRKILLGDIDSTVAESEGEDYASVDDWRVAHEKHWLGSAYEQHASGWQMPDDTVVVVEHFEIVQVL